MGLPSGLLREVFAIESPTETRNALGESVQSWSEVGRVYGSYEAVSYSEQQRRGQIGGSTQATVRIRYFAGLRGNWRLRWVSRSSRLLYVSAVVEKGAREEHELTVEEQAA
jgi:head-tail adaptor